MVQSNSGTRGGSIFGELDRTQRERAAQRHAVVCRHATGMIIETEEVYCQEQEAGILVYPPQLISRSSVNSYRLRGFTAAFYGKSLTSLVYAALLTRLGLHLRSYSPLSNCMFFDSLVSFLTVFPKVLLVLAFYIDGVLLLDVSTLVTTNWILKHRIKNQRK